MASREQQTQAGGQPKRPTARACRLHAGPLRGQALKKARRRCGRAQPRRRRQAMNKSSKPNLSDCGERMSRKRRKRKQQLSLRGHNTGFYFSVILQNVFHSR